MPQFSEFEVRTSYNTVVKGWSMVAEAPVAVVHILHGMMEHAARYRDFAGWMAERGFTVYIADMPGHGLSISREEDLGHLDDSHGWLDILESVRLVQDRIRSAHSGLPVILMGHSFGSAVARSFVQQYAQSYPMAGLVLSGAMQQAPALLKAGLLVTSLQKRSKGEQYRSPLMVTLGHGQYAKFFSPTRTSFDWLSSATDVVDAYIADPYCGYACTLGYYRNFFKALIDTYSMKNIRKFPKEMPVLLLGGKLDPAIQFGKDTRKLSERYEKAGMTGVKTKLFQTGRHEMLNEANRIDVYEYLFKWMKACI